MLTAATAWDGLASELSAAASSFGSVTSGLAGGTWQGPAAAAKAAAAVPYAGWLTAAASSAQSAAGQARAVATAFESAQAATVHPGAVAVNRNQVVRLVISNLFGQNAPAIAATEAQYEQMWAQDVSAMAGYHVGASAAAAQLPLPQQLRSLLGLGGAAAALPVIPGIPGNSGKGNTGFGNSGDANFGYGNKGNANVGFGNTGSSNLGFGNTGSGNIGIGNSGTNNKGLFNSGTGGVGVGNHA